MLNVLIIEDEPQIAEIILEILDEEFDVEFDMASNGFEGYRMASQKEYQLICTDFKMPVMNGSEFIKALRRKEGKSQNAVVLLITGYRPNIDADGHLWKDVYFLQKPFSPERIIFYANTALRMRPAQAEEV